MVAEWTEALRRWMDSVDDPWAACERADWFVFVAKQRRCSPPALIGAFARCMPRVDGPAEYAGIAEMVAELIATYAGERAPTDQLTDAIARRVSPQLIDWNHGRSYAALAESTPEGIPPPPPASAEPLRLHANAAMRLHRAAELARSGHDEWEQGLTLVAHDLVSHLAGVQKQPLYNQVEAASVPTATVIAHQELCDRLRRELGASAGPVPPT